MRGRTLDSKREVHNMKCCFIYGVSLPQRILSLLMNCALGLLLSQMLPLAVSAAPAVNHKAIDIYFIDVEGGQATLFVTPEKHSLLIDTGWPGNDGRDADRIVAAAKLAGISKIEYVLITHFHTDHVGGVPQLVARFPVGTFIDHGENRETTDGPTVEGWQAYQRVLATGKFMHMTVKPDDVLPIPDMRVTVISSDGALIDKPLSGAGGENPACSSSQKPPADQTENLRSLGTLITFGKLRILDLGDLTSDKEFELMCPRNKIGKIDIYIASHHGWSQSGSAALVRGIDPRVAIMDNGAKKGGSPSAWEIIKMSPHLEDLWQLHYSEEGGPSHNAAEPFIANLAGDVDVANYLKLTASADGSFEVFSSRTKATKHYAAATR